MKTTIAALALFALTFANAAPTFLAPTNPPASVQLAWNPSPDPTVTGYYLYSGTGSGQYTIKSAVNATNITITGLARGVTMFYAVTATDGSLESVFSNEVNYTPKAPPGAPTMKPPLTLVVQSRTMDSGAQWADLFNQSLSPDSPNMELRAKLERPILAVVNAPQLSPQEKADRALQHRLIHLPPAPGL